MPVFQALMDCGPRCLVAVCRNMQRPVALGDLVSWADCGSEGSTFAGLAAAAAQVGLHARGVRTQLSQLPTLLESAVGLVVQTRGRHFVAVLGAPSADAVSVYDPAISPPGPYNRPLAWLQARWTGNVLMLIDQQAQ